MKKKSRRDPLVMGNWNVSEMFSTRQVKNLTSVLQQYKIDVLAHPDKEIVRFINWKSRKCNFLQKRRERYNSLRINCNMKVTETNGKG